MLTIRRYHISLKDGKNYINPTVYEELKKNKRISSEDQFLFSLNRNDIINYVTKKDIEMHNNSSGLKRYYRFIATNNDAMNKIEVKLINEKTLKQTMLSIGKSVVSLEKYNVSISGKKSKVDKEVLKLEW